MIEAHCRVPAGVVVNAAADRRPARAAKPANPGVLIGESHPARVLAAVEPAERRDERSSKTVMRISAPSNGSRSTDRLGRSVQPVTSSTMPDETATDTPARCRRRRSKYGGQQTSSFG